MGGGQQSRAAELQPLPRSSGSTKTFRLRNVLGVFASAIRLFWTLRVQRPLGSTSQPKVRVTDNDPVIRSR
jgi:hypothetical protein